VNSDGANEQLREMVRLQREMHENQKQSFAQLIALQTQLIANQERDVAVRRKFLRIMGVLIVVYVIVALLPIWLR